MFSFPRVSKGKPFQDYTNKIKWRFNEEEFKAWKDRNTGEDRNKPVVRVDRLELLGSKRDSENSNFQNNNSYNQPPSNDEIPF